MSDGPLVFQCVACRTIVGDSLRTIGTFEELGAFSTEVCSNNVVASKDISTSTRANDHGATYRILHCAQCHAELGSTYLTTPARFSALRGAITFNISSLQSYALGDAVPAGLLPSHEGSVQPATAASTTHIDPVAGVSSSVEDELRAELLKIQTIILSLNERVLNIESREPTGVAEDIRDSEDTTSAMANTSASRRSPASPKRSRN
jgi:hypothetical protein